MTEQFQIVGQCYQTNARAAVLSTKHGNIPTPSFMPVASQATVKALTPEDLWSMGVNLIIANTYHLYLRPGLEVIQVFGGLHSFMSWDGPIVTDSGGYQVFSLAPLCKVSEEGVTFRSHIDGSSHFISPEIAIQLQEKLGADIIMPLDECLPAVCNKSMARSAMERTHRWALRCKETHQKKDQSLYAIVQGGMCPELRKESARCLGSMDFPGYAIGGLSLGESKDTMCEMLEASLEYLPEYSPHYLMGVGAPEDILEGVSRGVDLFDCALPTRVARNGAVLTSYGRRSIRNASFKNDDSVIDADCDCYTCRTFSTAYLHHLFKCEELLGYRLSTIHNVRFIIRLMEQIRESIMNGSFVSFKQSFLDQYQTTNETVRLREKARRMHRRDAGQAGEGNR
ncbi:MAG: tRNA guanosine(34) transglycosylase Tgt [Chloroflexota bacterium]|nr:tRNA guanosine(34) transglycosylase Tgt [Chloroflexota bacterium]